MIPLDDDNEHEITQEFLDSLSDWDTQYIPEWALNALINGDDEGLTPEDIKQISKYETKMANLGFNPNDFTIIRWVEDNQGDHVYEVDPDPVPAFCWNPSFGDPCNVYPVLYVKK